MRPVILALIFGTFFMSPANAQIVCGPYKKVLESLENGFSEALTSRGLSSNGEVVEVFASEKGSWTIIVTSPAGLSCLLAVGEGWENIPGPKKPVGQSL